MMCAEYGKMSLLNLIEESTMTTPNIDSLPMLDARDREEIDHITDPQLRDTIIASLQQYRRRAQVQVGDVIPALTVTRLADGSPVALPRLISAQPLVLIFGSVT